jgi:protein transport protein SEC24
MCRLQRPLPHPLTQLALDPAGAYLLDSGRIFVLWLGRAIPPAFMAQARARACALSQP